MTLVAPAPAATTAAAAALAVLIAPAALADVRQQRQLSRALDRAGDLVLVAPARAGDAARADLAAIGHELAQRGDVLVIDELHLVAAVRARLAPSAGASGLAIPPARRPAALLRHVRIPLSGAFAQAFASRACRGGRRWGAGHQRVADRARPAPGVPELR